MPIDYDKLPKSIQAIADKIDGKTKKAARSYRPPRKRAGSLREAEAQFPSVPAASEVVRQTCHLHRHIWYSKSPVPCFDCEADKEEAGTVNPGSQLGENGN